MTNDLRDDVVWTDGTPLTAFDFEYAWKRALDPRIGAEAAHLLYVVKGATGYHQGRVTDSDQVGIRAVDAQTLLVDLENPTGYFLHLLAGQSITLPVPRHVVEAHGAAWATEGNIVSNGAFQLEVWRPGQSLSATRNPRYHGRFTGNLERVELPYAGEINRDPSLTLRMYEADQLDTTSLPFDELQQVRYRHADEYVTAPIASVEYVAFDLTRASFHDPRVRCAFAHAIDRDRLAGVALQGSASPATGGFVPSGIPGHSPGIGLAYDPETARRLLSEAGYPNGQGFPAIEMPAGPSPWDIRLTEFLQAQWKQNLGVTVTLTQVDSRQYFWERIQKTRPALHSHGWTADYPDADGILRTFATARAPKWHNEDFNHLIESASRVSDQTERVRLYQAADRIFIQEAVVIPLSYGRSHLLIKPWIRRLRISPMMSWTWKDVVIEPH